MKTNPHLLAVLFDHGDGVAMIDLELRAALTGRNWILAQDFGRGRQKLTSAGCSDCPWTRG
jgi:hypothetical protein